MKHPPKPFAVEIKRSRRSSAPAASLDLFSKDSKTELRRPAPTLFAKSDLVSNAEASSDFVIPAFLQTDHPAQRTVSDSLSREAEELFGPKLVRATVQPSPPERAAPRILPSLLPEANPAYDVRHASRAVKERLGAEPKPARQKREKAPAPAQPAAHAVEAKVARKRAAATPADSSVKRKRATPVAAASRAKSQTAEAVVRAETKQETNAPAGDPPRRSRSRSFGWRGRENVASLPPGQHWKRRLNPRAW